MEEYEFEVTCQKCGETTWIYGTREEEEAYDNEPYTCLECREKEESNE